MMNAEMARKIRAEAEAYRRERSAPYVETMAKHVDQWIAMAARSGMSEIVIGKGHVLRHACGETNPVLTDQPVNATLILVMLCERYRELGFQATVKHNHDLIISW